jgi:hypothetical protein
MVTYSFDIITQHIYWLFWASRYVTRAVDFFLITKGTCLDQFIPDVSSTYRTSRSERDELEHMTLPFTYKWSVLSHIVLQPQITVIEGLVESSMTTTTDRMAHGSYGLRYLLWRNLCHGSALDNPWSVCQTDDPWLPVEKMARPIVRCSGLVTGHFGTFNLCL